MILAVRSYWDALRLEDGIPLRSRVDPRGLETVLDHAFLLERIAPGMARFRVAGHHLGDLMGMEMRGMPLSALFLPNARDTVGRLLEGVFANPQVAEIGVQSPGGLRHEVLAGTLLLLPLRDEGGTITRAMGCLVTKGTVGRTPRRLTVTEARTEPLARPTASAEDLPPGLAAPPPPAARAGGFAEEQAPFHTPTPSRRPYLRLVKSDPRD
ncbi:PAS domain-containing protein [Halodurantibacterium flavum]|uniref:PAS domain-containing protein n=1 Tax=Halodurantibacterium flavum TaxID=1382802 RepID=A0ABW4S3E5_9RHOB